MEESKCLIFLSHSGSQKNIAEQLFHELRRIDGHESSTFFDSSTDSIPIGGSIPNEIEKAIKACKLGVVLLSKEFIDSHWPMKELHMLFSRCSSDEACTIYPLFYDLDMKDLKDQAHVLQKWGSRWASFQGVDTTQWPDALCKVRWMRGEILHPNRALLAEIHSIACNIADVLRLPHPTPHLDLFASNSGAHGSFEILKLHARCQYTTAGSLFRANAHITFFMHPMEYSNVSYQRLFGQRPDKGHIESRLVHILKFKNGSQLEAYTKPIEGGNEWWELIWSDRGSKIHPSDHSCWRVRVEQIPNGFVCLSPYFFKIDSFSERMGGSIIPRGFLGYNDGHTPPSSDNINGMVAIKEDLVSYIPGENLIKVWDDRGSGATQNLSIYTGPDFIGCFAFPHHNSPIGGRYPILDHSKIRAQL